MNTAKAFGWTMGVAGVWEILAPFIIGYSAATGALWDSIIIGAVLIVLGIWTALSGNAGAYVRSAGLTLCLAFGSSLRRFSSHTVAPSVRR